MESNTVNHIDPSTSEQSWPIDTDKELKSNINGYADESALVKLPVATIFFLSPQNLKSQVRLRSAILRFRRISVVIYIYLPKKTKINSFRDFWDRNSKTLAFSLSLTHTHSWEVVLRCVLMETGSSSEGSPEPKKGKSKTPRKPKAKDSVLKQSQSLSLSLSLAYMRFLYVILSIIYMVFVCRISSRVLCREQEYCWIW